MRKFGWVVMLAVSVAALGRAASASKGHPSIGAQAALARFVAGGGVAAWPVESIEIHAGLPKMAKTAQLRAIRRAGPMSEAKYEVLEVSGDRTVKQQVIARYLSAENTAAELPSASVAITAANYKFTYKGEIDDGETLAYAFQITPRTKRSGLMKGELWLDQQSGVALRKSGTLVKSPSVWIKRVAITQEIAVHDGQVESRLTRIAVDTRLVGRAELVIEERPLGAADRVLMTNWDNGGQQ